MNMTSLVKSSLNGLSGSSSEAVAEGAGRATGEMASGEGARRDPEWLRSPGAMAWFLGGPRKDGKWTELVGRCARSG
jgi:hypothetical protein